MKTRFEYRHQYDDEADAIERLVTDVETPEPSLTQQQFKDEVNLNVMVQRFGVKDGAIMPQAQDPRHYGDFSDAVDFRDALDRTRTAIDRFNQLPANLRARFNNNPTNLYAFVTNPANTDEAVKLGLLKQKPREIPKTEPKPKTDDAPPS